MIDEKRAMTIARRAFGANLTSMPDDLYKLIDEAIKDERERCERMTPPKEGNGESFDGGIPHA